MFYKSHFFTAPVFKNSTSKLLCETDYCVKDDRDFNKILILLESESVEASAGELDWTLKIQAKAIYF